MAVKNDRWIIDMAKRHAMIEPFEPEQVRNGISFGVSSYGYDFRLADQFQLPDFDGIEELDPKNRDQLKFQSVEAESIAIPARSFLLGRSLEYFRIPRSVITVCSGKSTYARCGVIINVTPFEPEWEGFATLSIVNSSDKPVRIYANEGIAQLLFLESDEVCRVSYKDKKGKYQGQKEITLSRTE